MRGMYALFILLLLLTLAFFGIWILNWETLFGIVIPYFAITVFIVGMIYRVFKWASSPVPFKIPTTCGQQKSLSWIKHNNLESPDNFWGVVGRMLLEILFFRSLFRNTKAGIRDKNLVYGPNKWLWFGGLLFHWTFLIIVIRHFRLFIEPIPQWIVYLQNLDGLMEIGLPAWYISSALFLIAVTYLLMRRIVNPQIRYISLAGDYFPLFMILSIGITGALMRYVPGLRVDIVGVKALASGLMSFNPVIPANIGGMFYFHLFLVSLLLVYFPFSKLVHMGGVFLSPTRNMKNNSRAVRHVNPWNYPVKTHKYEEWEEEFHEVIESAGIPMDKEY